jgi:chloride channel 3/4/5
MDRLNQLPYLDSKHEYLWGSRIADEVADRTVPVLRADKPHTVRSLTGRLLELARGGLDDTGFPVLMRDVDVARDFMGGNGKEREGRVREGSGMKGVLRVVGFLGINELEHALGGFDYY